MVKELKDIIRVTFSLAKVSFRLRIEGSYLGIFWYLLNPLLLFAVLMLVKAAAFANVNIPYYPLYLLIGITGFNFFKSAITGAIDVMSNNPDYIKSINRVAPEALVASVVLQAVFSHVFEFIMIIALALYLQAPLVGLLFYPLVLCLFAVMILGISLIFATVGIYINDLNNVWLILTQVLLLATPIFYVIEPSSFIYTANLFNPLFYFLEVSRPLVMFGQAPDLGILLTMIGMSAFFLMLGVLVFNRYKNKFAELL